jgi:hypothetical protein
MEHFFLTFIAEAVKSIVNGLDGLFEKSLQRAIPDFDLLLEDPEKALDHRSIMISPQRKYCSAALVGLILAIAIVLVSAVILSIIQDRPRGQKLNPIFWWGTLGPLGLCFFVFGFRIIRGGYCILTQEGVEFRHRKRVVCCSWSVFNATGQPLLIKDSNLLLLPISPHATDSIMEMNKEETEAQRTGLDVQTPQWQTHSHFEAALKPLYVVKIHDLGDLLLRLGKILGDGQAIHQSLSANVHWGDARSRPDAGALTAQTDPDQAGIVPLVRAESRSFPIAFREKNGWIRMSLTRFYLPPVCCVCTVPTKKTSLFNLRNQIDSDYYPLHLFICSSCGDKTQRRKRIMNLFLLGTAILSMVPIVLSFQNGQLELLVLVMSLPVFSVAIMWIIAQRLSSPPAKVRHSSKKGTLHIRFRNRDYEKMVLDQKATN